MRKIFLFVLGIGCFVAKGQDIDVLDYQYLINLTDNNDSIDVFATIKFVYRKPGPVSFDLKNKMPNGRGMEIFHVDLLSNFGKKTRFSHQNDKLIFDPGNIEVNSSDDLLVRYKGIPTDGLVISKNKFGDRTFFADNWPNRAHNWIPCIDRPDDKATFEFAVLTPAHYKVVSNGVKKGETILDDRMKLTHWKEDIPQPTKVMVIGVARFATKIYDDSPKDIPVSAWVYPQDSAKGFYDYAQAPEILKFFADYIAPYPYKKLANVQSKTMFGGMENASAIFYNENYVTGKQSYEDVTAHEIAHQWFGDMVSEKSFAHIWLSEGFADYFTNFYFEKKYGKDVAAERWKTSREEVIDFAKTSSKAVVDSTEDFMSLMNANSYQKGAWVLRMLRNEVGDTVFQKIIQAYYNQYKGSNAETRDFEAVAEKVSGKELTWFFDQWLYQGGVPKLEIKWYYDSKKQSVVFKYNTPGGGKFSYKIPVLLNYKNGEAEFIPSGLEVNSIAWQTTIEWQTKRKPISIVLDPDVTLLFEVSITERKWP